jgi:hypothetical protein
MRIRQVVLAPFASPAPGWRLEQPEPGVMRWTTPSGRHYTTRPTSCEM